MAIAAGAVAGTATTIAADYRSQRVICAAGALGYAAALVVIGTAGSLAGVLAGAFLVGVASTAMVDALEVALADLAGDDIERQLTTQNLLGSIGDLAGRLVSWPCWPWGSRGASASWWPPSWSRPTACGWRRSSSRRRTRGRTARPCGRR